MGLSCYNWICLFFRSNLIVFGLYSNIVNKYGAYCSLLCGLIALLGLSPIKSFFNISVSSVIESYNFAFSAVL